MDKKNFTRWLKNLLVIDIETVSLSPTFAELADELKPYWQRKAFFLNREQEDEDSFFFRKATLHAEYAKVLAIGVGYFLMEEDGTVKFRCKAIHGESEKEVLLQFKELIETRFETKKLQFVSHNGKEFDYPFLCRRMLIHQIPLPHPLQLSGKRPWQIEHWDTMDMWQFGDSKRYTSLRLLATLFELPILGEEIDGSKVNDFYYRQKDEQPIFYHCREDVILTARVFLRLQGLADLPEINIIRL